MPLAPKPWSVYIVRCADGTLYTGICTNVEQRVAEHNGDDQRAARYTKSRRPIVLMYQEAAASRAQAAKREAQLKSLTRKQKEGLIRAGQLTNTARSHDSRR